MSYKFTTGSVRLGDIYYEDDRQGAATYINFGQDTISLRPAASETLICASGSVTLEGSLSLKEKSAAIADTGSYGQLWVKDVAPCELYFTTDAGDDIQLTDGASAAGGGGAANDDSNLILHMQMFT